MKRNDYEPAVNGLDYDTGTKVIDMAATQGGDSVQLHMDLRDEIDDIGYAVTMTRDPDGNQLSCFKAPGGAA
ncbi:MAG: hypothetical protein WBH47_18270 [Streptosporangiaceae bacterium]